MESDNVCMLPGNVTRKSKGKAVLSACKALRTACFVACMQSKNRQYRREKHKYFIIYKLF